MEDYFKTKKDISFIDNSISGYEKFITLIISMIFAVCMDRFFVDKYWGISVPIFTLAFVIFFLWSTKNIEKETNSVLDFGKDNILKQAIIISMVLIVFTFALFSNIILAFFNTIFIISSFTLYTILTTNKKSLENVFYLKEILKRLIPKTFRNFYKPFMFFSEFFKNISKIEMNSNLSKVLKGIVLALPLVILILILLSSADMIFNYYLSNIFRIFENIQVSDLGLHLTVIIIFFLYIFGFIWSFKYDEIYKTLENETKLKANFEPLTVMPILLMLNGIYLIFTVIQFSYLYGGGSTVLPSSFTYAEYARRGFFELVTVTVINFTIILCTMKFMKRENAKLERYTNVFLSLLIVVTLNMLFSAHYKMSLYENIYGYTYLRLFVHIFMLLLFILFLIAFAGIWIRKIPVSKICIIASLVMYVILNYINVDLFIVKKNVELYSKTKKLDVNYLANLSYDTLPYLVQFALSDKSEKSKELKEKLKDKRKDILDKEYSWYEFNYSRYKGVKALENFK